MKKFLTVMFASFLSLSYANAEILSVGVSGNLGLLTAKGKETVTGVTNLVRTGSESVFTTSSTATSTTDQESDNLAIGYVSLFSELHLFDTGLRLGGSYVPSPLTSETTNSVRQTDKGQASGATTVNQKVKVNLEEMFSLYAAYHHVIDDGFFSSVFVKAGIIQADVITKELLGSGSSYGNTTLEGEFVGLGLEKNIGPVFVRLEGSVTQFDDIKLTNTGSTNANTIEVTGLDGAMAQFSIGKSF